MKKSLKDYVHRVIGKNFLIENKLIGSNKAGYRIKSVSRYRLDWKHKAFKILNNDADLQIISHKGDTSFINGSSKHLLSFLPKAKLVQNVLQTLESRTVYIEFNFDKLSIIFEDDEYYQSYDLVTIIKNLSKNTISGLGMDLSRVLINFEDSPVITDNHNVRRLYSYLFNTVISEKLSSYFHDTDIILTGEMIWSGLLDMPIYYEIANLLLGSSRGGIYIDTNAVWYSFARLKPKKEIPLFFLYASELQKSIEFFGKEKIGVTKSDELSITLSNDISEKKIFLEKHRAGIFDLITNDYRYQGEHVGRFVIFSLFDSPEIFSMKESEFEVWWRTSAIEHSLNFSYDHFKVRSWEIVDEKEVSFKVSDFSEFITDFVENREIKKGDVFGKIKYTKPILYDFGDINIKKYISVVDGEVVNKGAKIAVLPTLGGVWGRQIDAADTGPVRINLAHQGKIIQLKDIKYDVTSSVDGRITKSLGRHGFKINLRNLIKFPMYKSTLNSFVGDIVKDIYTKSPSQKILLVDDLKNFDFRTSDLLENNVILVLFRDADYTYLLQSLKEQECWKWVGFGLLSQPNYSDGDDVYRILEQNLGKTIFGENDLLYLQIPENKETFGASDIFIKREESNVKSSMHFNLVNNQRVKIISYSPDFSYARIENTGRDNLEDKVLVVTEEGMMSVSSGNILPIE